MNRKILFTIAPKGYWIAFLIALLFVTLGGKYLAFANVAFNFLLVLIAFKLAIIIHEIGHLTFAKMVGGTPRRLVLGVGHKVAETRLGGVKIILNSNFNSGYAYAAFDNIKVIRLKLLAFVSGGFLANFLTSALLFLLFDFTTKASEAIQLPSAVIFANFFIGISVLIPRYANYQGTRLDSDGLSILRIPFYKRSHLLELSHVNELLDAFDLYEAKEYEEAIVAYESFQSKTEGSKTANINLSIVYMKLGHYEKAVQLLEEILPLIDKKPFVRYKNLIYNTLAWEYLLLNRLEEADQYSKLAYKIGWRNESIRGTRASVLIEQGKFEEGLKLLMNDVNFNFPNDQTVIAAIYLALALQELGSHKKAKKYQRFADENFEVLDLDEKRLYDRIKAKIVITAN